ncbi:MAG: hypothetical protein EAZ19_00350 [Oscillatoriales cyanobacterium]|nr:MAG: hypothetical protein EAZ94_00455 [Oscillatoriales cyanobacterium]TAE54557.1 MAG: hypothetical protein EAZ88_08710 [Oscillatoriales cyanobacterium]TAE72282.1 MAG: hypothetical protein EAZ86_00480 [Oscillatoriales cyanobacterium]TAF91143.1 MAG: hypothetical protein EAZ49_06400 [Oscillatoriales cyanobacterium]TAG07237.1 MAG: hypothetical protein EAZ45_02510 [Oscillatoriales cyanobacterium]
MRTRREHLILVKSIFSLSASLRAREYNTRELLSSHYKCKTEMLREHREHLSFVKSIFFIVVRA